VRAVVVLPTYNEVENIAEVLWLVRKIVPGAGILVVDDASPDGTADLAESTATEIGDARVLRRAGKRGLGSAYRDGFALAMDEGAEVLVEMDSDLSHDPGDLPALLAAVEHGADLAIGSRYVPGGSIPNWSWHRVMLSHVEPHHCRGARPGDVVGGAGPVVRAASWLSRPVCRHGRRLHPEPFSTSTWTPSTWP
jgi:dolichol-phosphate mannosyltransferase